MPEDRNVWGIKMGEKPAKKKKSLATYQGPAGETVVEASPEAAKVLKTLRDYDMKIVTPEEADAQAEKFVRLGGCHQCGTCCTMRGLFFRLRRKTGMSEEDLLAQTPEATRDEVRKAINTRCGHLKSKVERNHGKTRVRYSCDDYENRPSFCRKFPQLPIELCDGCGFFFREKEGTATCPACGRVVELVAGGKLAGHDVAGILRWRCKASGMTLNAAQAAAQAEQKGDYDGGGQVGLGGGADALGIGPGGSKVCDGRGEVHPDPRSLAPEGTDRAAGEEGVGGEGGLPANQPGVQGGDGEGR